MTTLYPPPPPSVPPLCTPPCTEWRRRAARNAPVEKKYGTTNEFNTPNHRTVKSFHEIRTSDRRDCVGVARRLSRCSQDRQQRHYYVADVHLDRFYPPVHDGLLARGNSVVVRGHHGT